MTPDSHTYGIVVIDSTGEAMAAGGVDSNADREVAQWFVLAKRFGRLPGRPAVLVLDHVPKSTEAPSSYAIGSQRKRAAVTGASYRVDTIKEPAKGKDGKLKLTVAKDRLGNRAKGSVACVIDITSTEQTVTMCVHTDESQPADGGRWRPTTLMEHVSRWIEDNPGCPKRDVLHRVSGSAKYVAVALEVLVDEGWVVEERRSGRGGGICYRSVRPFRDGPSAPVLSIVPPVEDEDDASELF